MTTEYTKIVLQTQLDMMNVEMKRLGQVTQAVAMWQEFDRQVTAEHARLGKKQEALHVAWWDDAGNQLNGRIEDGRNLFHSWILGDDALQQNPGMNRWIAGVGAIPKSITALQQLQSFIPTTYQAVKQQYDLFHSVDHGDPAKESGYMSISGKSMNTLASLYGQAKTALNLISGKQWNLPREAAPGSNQRDPDNSAQPGNPGPATTPNPNVPNPANTPNPTDPTGPQDPNNPANQQDPIQTRLSAAKSTLDSLSSAAQSVRQLLGGGTATGTGSVPNPINDLPSLAGLPDPASVLDSSYSPSGLPSLSGLGDVPNPVGGADFGGGIGGGLGAALPAVPTPIGADPLSGADSGAPEPSTSSTGTGSTTGTGSSSPSMYPPQTGGTRGGSSGGIRPGDAEQPGTGRSRPSAVTPGLALRGRAGRTKNTASRSTPPPPPRTRQQREPAKDTRHLLDEELWEVDTPTTEPRYRTGY